eukprot:TRINITY_DN9499_c0_g1_i1.p2 TRINITY_DN9499_c0_g1~~TRINITY_DN9499_c0_g1_i1.p2  ORF type:complete len:186 (+),score=1.03 TRINITY_DN9499_c0_g1_i1:323-880(+)
MAFASDEFDRSRSRRSDDLTAFEREELTDAFHRFDRDGDGRITADELSAVLRLLGVTATDSELTAMMRRADMDGNGSIDLDEFLELNATAEQMEMEGSEGSDDDVLREVFRVFDVDCNGYISAEELYRVMTCLEGDEGARSTVTLEECRAMIRKVDANGDGRVDFGEFQKMMRSRDLLPPSPIAC